MYKKATSCLLALLMVCVLALPVLAEENSHTTTVSYTGTTDEEYILIVPAKLDSGESGDVTLKGTWPSNHSIIVTADETVSMNDGASTPIVIDVNFSGINRAGDNEKAITEIKDISVAEMNALFGTWSGTFYYNLTLVKDGAVDGGNDSDSDAGDDTDSDKDSDSSNNNDNTQTLAAGLYSNGTMLASWNELVNTYGLDFGKSYDSSSCRYASTSGHSVLINNFSGYSDLKLIFPNSVTRIGCYAFAVCEELTSITLPDNVTSIGNDAFSTCTSLASVTLPSSMTSMENCLFWGCSSLTSITIPNSVISIGSRALYNCYSLTSITYTGTQAQWNATSKASDWDYRAGNYIIHCTDGDIY